MYETPLTDEELIEETKKTAYPELQQIFHKNDGTGANYYRIPALLTLKSGTVISAADARFGGTHDSPNNIDIAVLTIPKEKAIEVANMLVDNGVRAIWNFAHTDLNLPDNIVVENVHLSESLMQLSYNISRYKEDHK